MTQSTIRRPGGEPFLFEGGPVGVLLIHGYSGTPGELINLGRALAERGFTAAAPLLPGHGSTPDQMFDVRWSDWAAAADRSLAELRGRVEQVAVLGFSMGGLLALHLADRHPLAALVLLAPALRLRSQWMLPLTGAIRHVRPWYYPLAKADFNSPAVRASIRGFAPDANLDDPATIAHIRQAARVPVGSIYELVRLQRHVRRVLPRISAPALIMQGRHDGTVDSSSPQAVAARLGSPEKRMVWFERSGHMLVSEAEREQVWRLAGDWIEQHTR